MIRNLVPLFISTSLSLTLFASEVAVKEKPVCEKPVSILADQIISSPLNNDLIRLLETIERYDQVTQKTLALVLIEKQKVELCFFDEPKFWQDSDYTQFAFNMHNRVKVYGTEGRSICYYNKDAKETLLQSVIYEPSNNPLLADTLLGIACMQDGSFFLCYSKKIVYVSFTDNNLSFEVTREFNDDFISIGLNAFGNYVFLMSKASDTDNKNIFLTQPQKDAEAHFIASVASAESLATDVSGKKILLATGTDLLIINKRRFLQEKSLSFLTMVKQVAINAEGSQGVVTDEKNIYCVHLDSGSILKSIQNLPHIPTTVCLVGSEGHYAFFGDNGGRVLAWDTKKGNARVLATFIGAVSQLAMAANGVHLEASSNQKERAVIHIGKKARMLSLKTLFLLTKAQQYSLDELLGFKYFKNIHEELLDTDKTHSLAELHAQVITTIKEVYKECPICHQRRADCSTACQHFFCRECLVKVIDDANPCPLCRADIDYFEAPDGCHSITYKTVID